MSTQVILTLPDATYQRALYLAQLTGREVADVLADTIDISLKPLGAEPTRAQPVSAMNDTELLAAADSQMEPLQDRRFSDLLAKQQAERLQDEENIELHALMQAYQEGLLVKAQALHEAVRRGLRKPLEP